MTDSTPDDKNLAGEDAATEETVLDTTEDTTADEETAQVPLTKKSAEKAEFVGSAVKKRPAPPVEEDEDDEDYEEEAPVRRRPTPRPAARKPAAGRSGVAATATTVVVTVVILALLATSILFGVLWGMKKSELNDVQEAAANRAQAEKVAAEYAAGASTFDFRDLTPWRSALTKGVSPELKTKLEATVGAMNQLLQPLQWVSKGTVMDAVVNSESGSIFKVNAYVRVEATNVQAASGREVVTVYNVTLDKDKDWQITDVGGVGGGVPATTGAQTPAPTAGETPAAPAPAPGN
ncbi:hypothetical protein [Tsukamurella paurometabola]|uniref:Mce-associated membrane protein n=1 Tax=Tsukamurella paurometabola TaxID=2061 RepID=A0ABS5NGH4_TSUPA|nr:hypothetical protein [Tsukamurella paurometabola]MBS4103399.1 hypothetical protein [Tsukamurella paurometabola]